MFGPLSFKTVAAVLMTAGVTHAADETGLVFKWDAVLEFDGENTPYFLILSCDQEDDVHTSHI